MITYARIRNLERVMFMGSRVAKNRARFFTDPVLFYYAEKYWEVLERAVYHLEQGRREYGDSL